MTGQDNTVPTLTQEVCKDTVAEWNDAASDYVRGKMFDRKQFVTKNADLVETGGHIQKLVALELHINGPRKTEIVLGGTWREGNNQKYC